MLGNGRQDAGAQGSAGAQGFQGDQGFQGVPGTQGFQGDIGPQGFQGDTGAQGFQGPMGATGINWLNAWSNATAYNPNDAVSENGSSYIALLANTGMDPTNDVNTSGGNWALLAQAGATGPQGFQGGQGTQGIQGTQGNTGAGPQGNQITQAFRRRASKVRRALGASDICRTVTRAW